MFEFIEQPILEFAQAYSFIKPYCALKLIDCCHETELDFKDKMKLYL